MFKTLLLLCVFCFSAFAAQPAAADKWSKLNEATKFWLYSGVDDPPEAIYASVALKPFVNVNFYTTYQFLMNPAHGWKIGKMLNYPDWENAGPSIFQTFQISQRPYAEARVPVSVYYFIEKINDPSKHLIVIPYSSSLYVLAPAKDKNDSSSVLAKEFEKDFLKYSEVHNPFKGAVIEYRGGFRFLEKAEKLNSTWDHLIFDPKLKEDLKRGIEGFLMNYDYAQWKKLGLPLSQGVLLSGAPGTGKSMVAKIIATSVLYNKFKSVFTYIHVQANNVYSESDIKVIYDMARAFGNSIIYFEDIDLIAGTTRFNRPAIKNELMQQLSGIEKLEGVLTVGTTNLGSEIDPALKRSQRLGLHYEFSELLMPERAKLLDIFFKGKTGTDLDLNSFAIKTDHFSGADLQLFFQISFDGAFKKAQDAGLDLKNVKVSQADAEYGLRQYRKLKFKSNSSERF